MSTEATVAIIMAAGALIAAVVNIYQSASKNDLEILRGIIAELRTEIEDLKAENGDLKDWAERLVCQVKENGLKPVEYIRHRREEKK
jgi:cell division protein FtsL